MRITLALNDRLLAATKARAAECGETLSAYVEEALRLRLSANDVQAPQVALSIFARGTGVGPGIDLSSNRSLYDALDDAGDLT